MERRIEPGNYRTGSEGARRAIRIMTRRWGWVVVDEDCMGWTLVKPHFLEQEHQALLDAM